MQRKSRRPDRRFAMVALCGLLASVSHARSVAATEVGQADSSRAARSDAQQAVPLDQMTPEAQQRLKRVLDRPSLYRRLPTQRIVCDSEMHLFLVRHPEVIVNMWTMMGITNIAMSRVAPYQLQAADGKGTECEVELVYGTPHVHVAYGEGTYEGPVFRRKIKARCVCLVRTDYQRNEKDEIVVTNTLDIFLQFDSFATELLARTVQPLITKAADHNFAEAMNFIERINQASEKNGPGVERLSRRMRKVDAETREKFAQVASAVHQRAVMREAATRLSDSAAATAARR